MIWITVHVSKFSSCWGQNSKRTLLPTSYTSAARPPYISQKNKNMFLQKIFPNISQINSRIIFIQKYPRNYCSTSSQIAYKLLLCFFVKMCFAKLHVLTVHLQTSHILFQFHYMPSCNLFLSSFPILGINSSHLQWRKPFFMGSYKPLLFGWWPWHI